MKKLIGIELKRDINRATLVILIFFILSVLFINYSGLKRIKGLENTKDEFIKNESKKVESYYSYRPYGWAGFKLLFAPSPISVMFNSTTINNLQASIDISFKFEINNPKRGEYVFQRSVGLTWFLKIIGGILALILGWLAFRCREYIKTLLNYGSKFFVYCSILAARIILIFLSLCLLTICLFAQSYIMGGNLNGFEITIIKIMLFTFAVMIFFLLLGVALGTIKRVSKSGVITFIFVLILLFLWPNFLNLSFSGKAVKNTRSIYSVDSDKVSAIYEFEKMRINYVKDKEDKIKATKELSEKFFNDGKIEKLELELIDEDEKNIKKFHLWSILNPVTFYESTVSEMSGNGFNEQQRFCRESLISA